MKPSFTVPIHQGVFALAPSLRMRCKTLLAVVVAVGLGSGAAFSQGIPPGNYYQPPFSQSDPSTQPGGAVTGATFNELYYVNSFLPPNATLYYPVPSGQSAATSSQLATAVAAAAQQLITSPGSAPAGVSLGSLGNQLVANQISVATQTAPAGSTAAQIAALQNAAATAAITALANSIATSSATPNGSNGTPALTNLNSLVASLTSAYPSTASNFIGPVFTSAASLPQALSFQTLGTNTTGAYSGIAQLALTASTSSSAVSGNDQALGAIVTQAVNAVANSSASLYTTTSKQAILQNIVAAEYSSSVINSSQASISAVADSMITDAVVNAIPPGSIPAYVQSAVNALPAASRTNTNIGAVYLGMVASGAIPESDIITDLQAVTIGSANTYVAAMHTGYTSSSSSVLANMNANKGLIDAIIAGAVMSGRVSETVLINDAFSVAGSTTSAQNIVAAAIASDVARNPVDNAAAIASTAIQAADASTFSSIAQGAVGAGRTTDAGAITSAMIKASPGYSSTASSNALAVADVQSLVSGAMTGAYAGAYGSVNINSKPGAIAQIVFQAEMAASTFSGANASQSANFLPLAEAVVAQAISSMKILDPSNPDLPTYLAAAAAFAGYGGPASNLPAIANSITSGTPTSTNGIDTRPAAVAAINAAESVVSNYKTASNTGFTQTIASFGANAAAPDSVMAVLYGASLSSINDAPALLAAAIGRASGSTSLSAVDSDANLLAAAISANPSIQANLTIANAVALHIETNILAHNNNDISNYVGYQAAQNPSFVADIAAAAVAVDPNHSNYVAETIAYNAPLVAYKALPSIFAYDQITSKFNNSNPTVHVDESAVAAAISAGYATGIVKVAKSPTMTVAMVQAAFVNGVSTAVGAAIIQNGVKLTGANMIQAPTVLSSIPGMTTTITIDPVTGVPTYSGASTNTVAKPSVGAAGVVTGIISQVVSPGDTTLGGDGTLLTKNGSASDAAAIVNAILKATVYTVQNGVLTGSLNPVNNLYVTQIAQAAGQAFGYISGGGTANLTTQQEVALADQIAADLTTASMTSSTYKLILYAAYFGLTQGQSGIVGAGAAGVSKDGNYSQHSATGNPITDVYNL